MHQHSITHLKSQNEVITPDQVVALLLGSETVTLTGFGGVPTRAPFWVPVVARHDTTQVSQAYRRSMKVVRWVSGSALAIAVVVAGSLLFWAGGQSASGEGTRAGAPVAWTAKAVVNGGVVVNLGTQDVTVPLGSILPNGEMLRDLDVRLQTFSTDSQITAVKR